MKREHCEEPGVVTRVVAGPAPSPAGTGSRRAGATASDAVDVWLVRTNPPSSVVAEMAALLDADERDRAARLDPTTSRRFVVAHGALRVIVGRYLDTPPEQIRWIHGRYGKPALSGDRDGWEVSLSHAGDLSAVAISQGRAVGVDLQRMLPRLDPVAMSVRYFPPGEARFVTATADPGERSERFTRLWARKEAYVKAVGGRLADGLRLSMHRPGDATGRLTAGLVVSDPSGGPRVRIRDLPVPPGLRAAVALLGQRPFECAVRWWPQDHRRRKAGG